MTGGHTGSRLINEALVDILRPVIGKFIVIHQTGIVDFPKFQKLKIDLDPELSSKYHVYSLIPPKDWPEFLSRADIILSRSGANIVSQVLAIKRPTIFIPLSIAYKNEQYLNAKYAVDFGIAEILLEKDVSPESILQKLELVESKWSDMVSNVSAKSSPDKDASTKVINLIDKELKSLNK